MTRAAGSHLLFRLLASCLSPLCLCACGAGFETGSEINTLRVLGVRKDNPYPRPGESVTLNMLWYDGAFPDGGREIQRTWLPIPGWIEPCINPLGDAYYACFAQFAEQGPTLLEKARAAAAQEGAAGQESAAEVTLGTEIPLPAMGDSLTITIPPNIVDARPAPTGDQQRYGLTYVFFAVCAGKIFAKLDQRQGFPLVCKDSSGNYLGADDFVAGYSSLYSYPADSGITNQNPVIDGFEFNGAATERGACIGTACSVPGTHPSAEEGQDMPRVPACVENDRSKCQEYPIRPLINQASTEEYDALASKEGATLWEQSWVRYSVEQGELKSQVRLLSDARTGWDNGYGTTFRAPAAKGPLFLWTVVQDSRGGEQWVRQTVFIE